jgi:hypothetical protein
MTLMRTKNKKQAPKEANQLGLNSVKDSNKATSKLAVLRVDERGADLNLVAVFSIIDLLTKTPIRNAANNPIIEPVPPTSSTRHGHPCRTNTPPDEAKNHRPTDDHIKNTVILALASSSFTHHSSLADQFQQVDHATRTWTKKLPRTFNPASKTQPGEHHGTHHPSHAEHAPTTLTGPPIPAHPPHLTRIATPAKNKKKIANFNPTTTHCTAITNGIVTTTTATLTRQSSYLLTQADPALRQQHYS